MIEPKVLLFDLETSPNVGYFWSSGHQINVGTENIVEERQVICVAYKWLGQKKTYAIAWDYNKGDQRDKKLLKEFSKIYAEADMVIAHNGDRFDIPWLKTRIMYHDLDPLPPVHQCDTLKEFRKNFRLNSNRLDYVAKLLTGHGKNPMSFDDWKKIMQGHQPSLNKMVKYCKVDVDIMEQVYLRTRRHLQGHGIMQSYYRDSCPQCGSESARKYGKYRTKLGAWQKYQCDTCMHIYKGEKIKE